MRRGELWWLDYGEPVGSSPGFERPAVIVSADSLNRSAINTIITVPLYSKPDSARHVGNVVLRAAESVLAVNSVAIVSQVAVVDRQSIIHRIGAVPPSLMRDIDAGLRLLIDL